MVKEQLAARLSEIITTATPINSIIIEVFELVNNTTPPLIWDTLQNINTAVVFEKLFAASSNGDCVILLQKLIGCLPPPILVAQFRSSLIHGLHHPNLAVKEVVLKELERCLSNAEGYAELMHCNDILCMAARLLGDSNINVAKHSSSILYSIGGTSEGVAILLGSLMKRELIEIMAVGGETVKLRVYDVMISIVCDYPSALPLIATEYSEQLLTELESDDILIQLNCIELLTKLALTQHGLIFLEQQGAVEKFRSILLDSSDETQTMFLFPGLIKFFGNFGLRHPEKFFDHYSDVLHYILTVIEYHHATLIGVAIETFGVIGSSTIGKRKIDAHAQTGLLDGAFRTIGQLIEAGPSSEIRLRALLAFTNLLSIENGNASLDSDRIIEKWLLKATSGDPIRLLLTVSKQPFPEMCCGALQALKQIAARDWGQKLFIAQPGFFEYLLDRSTVTDKDCKEGKYGIVKAIVDSSTGESVLNAEILTKLRQFYKEGPFFVTGQTEVAFEQAS